MLSLGGGQFRTWQLSAQYVPVQGFAYFDERVVARTVYVGRRP